MHGEFWYRCICGDQINFPFPPKYATWCRRKSRTGKGVEGGMVAVQALKPMSNLHSPSLRCRRPLVLTVLTVFTVPQRKLLYFRAPSGPDLAGGWRRDRPVSGRQGSTDHANNARCKMWKCGNPRELRLRFEKAKNMACMG